MEGRVQTLAGCIYIGIEVEVENLKGETKAVVYISARGFRHRHRHRTRTRELRRQSGQAQGTGDGDGNI
jgi:hypothetical protein